MTADSDGNTVLEIALDIEKLNSELSGMFSGLLDGMGSGTDADMNISDVQLVTTVNKDGYIIKQDIKMNMDVTTAGQTVATTAAAVVEYINPGQEVTIDFPDFSDYVESEGDLGGLI